MAPEKNQPSKEDADYDDLMDELFGDLDDTPEAPVDTVKSLRTERDALLSQVNRVSTAFLEASADNEKSQRALKEAQAQVEPAKQEAVKKFVLDTLPAVDNLERALSAITATQKEADPKFAKLADGVEKTLSQIQAAFNKHGVHAVDPLGQEFDENKHEVIAAVAHPDTDPGTVVQVQQKGYEMNGKLIRPAKVIVTPLD